MLKLMHKYNTRLDFRKFQHNNGYHARKQEKVITVYMHVQFYNWPWEDELSCTHLYCYSTSLSS